MWDEALRAQEEVWGPHRITFGGWTYPCRASGMGQELETEIGGKIEIITGSVIIRKSAAGFKTTDNPEIPTADSNESVDGSVTPPQVGKLCVMHDNRRYRMAKVIPDSLGVAWKILLKSPTSSR